MEPRRPRVFFLSGDRRLMTVPVRTAPALAVLAIVTGRARDDQPMTAVPEAFASLDR